MRPLNYLIAVIQAVVAMPGWSLAQTATSSTSGIETLVVTASRVSEDGGESPYATSVLTSDEILNGRPTLTLGEALSQVPGVFVTSRFNFTQDTRLSIRGFGARSAFGIRGVRVLLDGIPLTLPDGQSQVDSIDMASVGRIDLLRGPAGSLYGNAAGGVLALSSVSPTDRPEVEFNTVVGSFDLVKTAITGRAQVDNVGFTLFASRTRFGGWRDNSTAEQYVAQARVVADLAPSVVLTSQLHYVRGPEAQDPGGVDREQFETSPKSAAANNLRFQTGEDLSQLQFGSRLVAELSDHHRIELVGHAGVRTFEGNIPFRVIEFDRDFFGGQLIYRHQDDISDDVGHRLSVGFEAQAQQDDRRNEGNDDGLPDGEVSLNQREQAVSIGAYLQERLNFSDALVVLGSARYDRVEFDVTDRLISNGDTTGERVFDQVTGQAGVIYTAAPYLKVFANISQSFETPTFTELVNSAPDGGLSADLDAQRALSIEAGVRGEGETFAFEASGFWIDLNNELLAREDEQGRSIFTNAGESERFGVELFGRWELVKGLELRGAYSFLQAQFKDGDRDGNRIPGLPEHRLFGRLRWTHSGFHVAAEVEFVGGRFVDDTNLTEADAFALAEIRAGYRTGISHGFWLDFTVGVRNLFDVAYADNVRINAFGDRFFESGPPLHAYGSLAIGWQGP